MMGTPGYTSFEGMSPEPVKGATGHDVFAIAMVLLRVCLKKTWRCPNLFTHPVRGVPRAQFDAVLRRVQPVLLSGPRSRWLGDRCRQNLVESL